ncbi:MAG: LemA family protein [Pseudomonadota bacterium]
MDAFAAVFIPGAVLLLGAYAWYATIVARRDKALDALIALDAALARARASGEGVIAIAQRELGEKEALLDALAEVRSDAGQPYDRADSQAVARHLSAERAARLGLGRAITLLEERDDVGQTAAFRDALAATTAAHAQIADAQTRYNAAAAELNAAIGVFPGTLFARRAQIGPMTRFMADETPTSAPADA